MNNINNTEVLIYGRKYTICGFESDEYLQNIATYLNKKHSELKANDGYNRMDLELRSVLLDINIADDYHKENKKANELKVDNELKQKTILDMKHEMISLNNQISELTEEKKKLEKTIHEKEKKIVELETKLKK